MRQISADLAAVQRVRSPRARVSITVEARGQNPEAPAVAWTELVGNSGQATYESTAAVGLGDGSILKFVARNTNVIEQYHILAPKTAAGWSGITPTTVASIFVWDLCAVRIPGTSTIRLFYIDTSNHVLYRESTDEGDTWGSAVTVYSGGDATRDLCAAYISNGTILNGPWFVGFSTYNGGTGAYTPRFGYYDSGWTTHAYSTGWRAAGIYGVSEARTPHRVLVFRQADSGTSRIRALEKSGSSYSSALDVDETQAGLAGLQIAVARYFQLPEAGCTLGMIGERAYGGDTHLGIGGFFMVGSSRATDEPIALPEIEASSDKSYAALCSVADGNTVDLYLVGDTVVYRGAAQAATSDTLTPIRYRYQDGQFEIDFKPGIDALYVGQILVITRTLAWGSQAGSETIRAYVVRVAQRTDVVRVLAADALAFLGICRCRRPVILSDGSVSAYALLTRLLARVGLPMSSDDGNLSSEPTLPFTLQPNESLAGAAYRAGSQTAFYLVPANDGSFGLTMINPPTSDSGDYDDTAHVYGAGSTQQPVIKAGIIRDYRRLAFAYILGSYSTDPEDGAYLKMAAGPVVPNTRPISYSLTNMRYNSFTRVQDAAAAEAARQFKLTVDGFIEGNGNLAIELYDVVEVTEPLLSWSAKVLRVRGIREWYDRGRLTQRLDLGDEA